MSSELTADDLSEKFRSIWKGQPPDAEWYRKGWEPALRIHRAISWVKRAQKEVERAEKLEECVDLDAKFIFYWIAFNAAYGRYKPISSSEKSWEFHCIDEYLNNVLAVDVEKEMDNMVWDIRSSILGLMENRYVFRDLWNFHRDENDPTKWDGSSQKESFDREYKEVEDALNYSYRVKDVLFTLFKRIYTMRCQFFHGSSSWKSPINREQVEYGVYIMECLVPLFLSRMMNDPNPNRWGTPQYPRYPDIQDH